MSRGELNRSVKKQVNKFLCPLEEAYTWVREINFKEIIAIQCNKCCNKLYGSSKTRSTTMSKVVVGTILKSGNDLKIKKKKQALYRLLVKELGILDSRNGIYRGTVLWLNKTWGWGTKRVLAILTSCTCPSWLCCCFLVIIHPSSNFKGATLSSPHRCVTQCGWNMGNPLWIMRCETSTCVGLDCDWLYTSL